MTNRERIMGMREDQNECICPNCEKNVYPRFHVYDSYIYGHRTSGVLWCPKCLKGQVRMFWIQLTGYLN